MPRGRPKEAVDEAPQATRYFGLLHCYIIEGEAILHSWLLFRRKNKTTCWDAEACIGKADPYCAIHLLTEGTDEYRLGRTPTISRDHYPKWKTEFSQIIDQLRSSNPKLIIKVLDADMGGDAYSDVLGQTTFPLSEIVKRGKPLRVSLSIRHPMIKAGKAVCKAAARKAMSLGATTRMHSERNSDQPPLKNPPVACMSRVKVEFRWYDMSKSLLHPDMNVPQTYFRRSHGNLMRLYHDAECLPGQFPNIYTLSKTGAFDVEEAQHSEFVAHSAWSDIAEAISNAQHFVFVAGWSVNPAIRLLRDDNGDENTETIGELLKRRADEGLSVCVIVWDDITSREGVAWLKDGLMATYDEYTREYFRNTKVKVAVARRVAGDDVGEISEILKWSSFTHHQKIVCYDAEGDAQRRVVGAFVGGLDLTSGRYDTAAHCPFSTLTTRHKADFYNGCLVEATAETGPREPWHDIHARILGPAAWDILQTFIERISKQAPDMVKATAVKIAELRDNRLLKDGRKVLVHPERLDSWDVQVFRSLDSEAALFENAIWTARFANNTHFVDRSIQQAYAYIIKKSQHYLYIENQYFLGSSQYWLEHSDVPCHNLIPWLIAERICQAIRENNEYCVYILIPLFPEGAPASASVQEILQWQFQTQAMMYHKIAKALAEAKSLSSESTAQCRAFGKHPTDYLSFFFCGVREIDYAGPSSAAKSNLTPEVHLAVKTRRHPIYIHSKLMIVDDEYLILGSANINERSLNGSRDTEIAVGCLQPRFRTQKRNTNNSVSATPPKPPSGILRASNVVVSGAKEDQENKFIQNADFCPGACEGDNVDYARGDVRAFRLQLWHEHLGSICPEFEQCPESFACMRLVRARAQQNWEAYVSPDNVMLPHGHLCIYPLSVSEEGQVDSLKDHASFPGWPAAAVAGHRITLMPSVLTT